MKYRTIGKSGIEASVVGFGAWAIGGWMWGGSDETEAVKAIHAALDAGMNLIDTAAMYGFGNSEEIVGRALKGRRDKAFLATKCGLIWHQEQGEYFYTTDEKGRNEQGHIKVYRCLAPDMIRYEVEQSLKRLNTDYIDLYQTHWQDSTTRISDTMETLLELKAEGKIRAIGCCNADVDQMEQYSAAGQLDCDQELYSMLDRGQESHNLAYAADTSTAFMAYSPLAQGMLTGKIGPDRIFNEGDQRISKPRFSVENRKKVGEMLEIFLPVAEKHGVTLGQLTIAWTIAQRGCTHALVGARTAAQVLENVKGGSISLDDEDLGTINGALKEFGGMVV